ncbi:MAG: DUF4136 domain-containing protein [Bacteroidales bacterium]
MKKFIPFLFALVLFASCEKEPDTDKLHNQYMVYTQYDKDANFEKDSAFYIPDSILVIGGSEKPVYWTDAENSNAKQIIAAYVANMTSRGYKQTNDKEEADLGLQVSYIENTNYFVDYPYDNWWGGYPGYWGPGYWGSSWNNYGWYYPFPIVYSYSTGSLLTELVDLKTPGTDKKMTVLWNSFISGLLSGNETIDITKTVSGINQSFNQSTYLKTTLK